ncbi:MAG: type 11 methyltransferase, partial [Thermoleophilia bacterium]|nr:type 11 methyltransferase [Thermoleophilia bacterium]
GVAVAGWATAGAGSSPQPPATTAADAATTAREIARRRVMPSPYPQVIRAARGYGSPMDLTEHAARNRDQWDRWASDYVPSAERNWATADPTWGIWDITEADAQLFGAEGIARFAGRDAIELGCGAGYVSSWLARAGARVTGIDVSQAQLATARRLQAEHGLDDITFLEASAEAVPLPDASFDLAISEYGACLWCEPERWVPEAARLLRPGGELVFLTNGILSVLCMDTYGTRAEGALQRPLFDLHRLEWPDDDGDDSVEFHLPHGAWMDLLAEHGFTVERLVELQAPVGATTRYEWADHEWARKWPTEEAWIARRA